MAWHVIDNSSSFAEITLHDEPQTKRRLTVAFHPRESRHAVSLSDEKGDTAAMVHEAGETRVVKRRGGYHVLSDEAASPPSDRLRTLIEVHERHPDQWPILLDALQEEYPQLHEAIESHHAARRAAAESDATQYARALEATLADLRSDTPLRVTRFAADGTRTVTTERPSEIATNSKATR